MNKFKLVFGVDKPLIGMVHLEEGSQYPSQEGKNLLIQRAIEDAQALEAGGVDAINIENDFLLPHTIKISQEQADFILELSKKVAKKVSIPLGLNVLLNDWKRALDITKAIGGKFVRIDVFVDRVSCVQGVIEPEADAIVAYRKKINAEDILLCTDIQVKHKSLLEEGKTLETSAQQAIDAGTDVVIVTGNATGEETPLSSVQKVKKAFPNFPVFIGAGLDPKNVKDKLALADGAFVGTSLKSPLGSIDQEKVAELVQAAHELS